MVRQNNENGGVCMRSHIDGFPQQSDILILNKTTQKMMELKLWKLFFIHLNIILLKCTVDVTEKCNRETNYIIVSSDFNKNERTCLVASK